MSWRQRELAAGRALRNQTDAAKPDGRRELAALCETGGTVNQTDAAKPGGRRELAALCETGGTVSWWHCELAAGGRWRHCAKRAAL